MNARNYVVTKNKLVFNIMHWFNKFDNVLFIPLPFYLCCRIVCSIIAALLHTNIYFYFIKKIKIKVIEILKLIIYYCSLCS